MQINHRVACLDNVILDPVPRRVPGFPPRWLLSPNLLRWTFLSAMMETGRARDGTRHVDLSTDLLYFAYYSDKSYLVVFVAN